MSICPKCGAAAGKPDNQPIGDWLCGSVFGVWERAKFSQSIQCRVNELEQQLAAAPAWRDYPTHVGLWFGQFRGDGAVMAVRIDEAMLVGISSHPLVKKCRWYPVPADTPPLPPTLLPSADDGAPPAEQKGV